MVPADEGKECVGLFDCPDGRLLLVAHHAPEGPVGDLAGYLPGRGTPSASDVLWHQFEREIPTRPDVDEGRLVIVGDCPTLDDTR